MTYITNLFKKNPFKTFLFILIFFALVTIHPQVTSWNDASRMATIQSIVENHTLIIDHSTFSGTGDKVFINGHYYSSKPIFAALMGTVVYYPLYHLGIELDYGVNLAYYLINLFVIKLLWVFGILAFYRILKMWKLDEMQAVKGGIALGFGSLFFTYSSTFSNNFLSASFILIGFYFFLRTKQTIKPKLNIALSGLFFSLAGSVDIPTILFFGCFALIILLDSRLRKYLPFFLLPLLVTILPTYLYYYLISGSFMPFQLSHSLYQYPDSAFTTKSNLSGFYNESLSLKSFLIYFFNSLFWERGLFFYTPFLLVSTYYLFQEIRHRKEHYMEALAVSAASLALIMIALFFTTNYGGNCYGFRWLVPIIPVNLVWLYPMLQSPKANQQKAYRIILLVSIIIAVIGLANPWSPIEVSNHSIIANLVEMLVKLNNVVN